MNYHFILETFHKFAFYFCVIPYRIRKNHAGIYATETVSFQKVVSITFYILPHYWHVVQIYNKYRRLQSSRNVYLGDPTPYFSLLFEVTFSVAVCILMHKIVFYKAIYTQYLNKFSKVSNNHNAQNTTNHGKILKLLIILFLLFYSLIGMNIFFIGRHYNITLEKAVAQARKYFMFEELSSYIEPNESSVGNYFIAFAYIMSCAIKNVQIFYCTLHYVISIYGLVVLSKDFRYSSQRQSDADQILTYYRSICRLTRYHDRFYGCGLLWFLFSGLFYCPYFVFFANKSSDFGSHGTTFLKIQLGSLYIIILGLGTRFLRMMGDIDGLLVRKESLGQNRKLLTLHFKNRQFCKIQASVMPITFLMINMSAVFAMTLLIVTMSPECPKLT